MLKPDESVETIVTFVDNGFSGSNIERKGFQDMMKQVEMGTINKIIVYRLDRISRSLSDFVDILNTLKRHNVKFISSRESFDTSSPYGEMIVKILMIFAEFERQSTIERITQAYQHRSELGFYMGGRKPYGFELSPIYINNVKTKKLSPISEEIEQIQYIYELYSAPNATLGKVLKSLIDKKIAPCSGSGWTTAKLSSIIKNPIYVKADNSIYEYFQSLDAQIISPPESFDGIHGIQLYGKTKHEPTSTDLSDIKVVIMPHNGIIDSDIWLKCRKKLEKNKQIRNSVSNKASWLGGKLKCGKCGRVMTTTKGNVTKNNVRVYFNCIGKSHYKDCDGIDATIYAQSLENAVYYEIADKLKQLKSIKINQDYHPNPEINKLKNTLKSIELDEIKLADALMQPGFNPQMVEILNNRAVKLKSEKTSVVNRISELESTNSNTHPTFNLTQKWDNATFEEKRSVCAIMIEKIEIDEKGDIKIFWNI